MICFDKKKDFDYLLPEIGSKQSYVLPAQPALITLKRDSPLYTPAAYPSLLASKKIATDLRPCYDTAKDPVYLISGRMARGTYPDPLGIMSSMYKKKF